MQTNHNQPAAEIKIFSLFTQSGKPEEIKPVPALPMYCKIFNYGYAMSEGIAAIISGPDQFGTYKAVLMGEYNPGFIRVDKYARPHSKKFGIGSYFDDQFATFPENEVREAILRAEEADRKKAQAKAEQEAADKKEIAELPAKYPYLTPIKYGANWKERRDTTKANLTQILKREFPGVKFSVKKISSGDGYDISWTNGPTIKEVERFSQLFDDHKPDISGDYHDRESNNFQKVFGSVKYIFENRALSPEIYELRSSFDAFFEGSNIVPYEIGNIFSRVINSQSYPLGAYNFKIERRDEVTAGSREDFYKVSYSVPEVQEKPQITAQGITLIDYSPKAIAIIGDTIAIKDTLKNLGGRFNKFLSCGAGWIFPKTKETELRTALGI